MIQFNVNRFWKLVRWSLTMDRRWFVKNTLSWLVVFTLVFLFFTCVTKFNDSGLCVYGVMYHHRHSGAGSHDDVQ